MLFPHSTAILRPREGQRTDDSRQQAADIDMKRGRGETGEKEAVLQFAEPVIPDERRFAGRDPESRESCI